MTDTAHTRRQLISLALRRQRPGMGSSMALLEQRTAFMQFPDLTSILGPIPWAVVGAVATRLYMPEWTTRVLDVLLSKEVARQARRRLTGEGFRYQGELSIGGSSWVSPEGIAIDVVEMEEPWLPDALLEAQDNRNPQGLLVLPLAYLVLMKFEAGRVQDLAYITRMLGQAGEQELNDVRQLFARYSQEDLEDLESLILLGRMEMEPPPP